MNTHLKVIVSLFAILISPVLNAREISGVNLPDQINLAGQALHLNGAGIRTKFVFDIYIGALYLPQKTKDIQQALTMPGPKRVLMHFLYDEVEKEKLTDGWNTGFENNLSDKDFAALKSRLQDFNNLFVTAGNGDQIILDYLPDAGTRVIINKQLKGAVPGEDFNRALLKVWLGEEPADEDLKAAMLGNMPDSDL